MKKNLLKISVILFFSLYITLPSYFAIEFSESLPLITGSRIVLGILLIAYLINKNEKINFKIFENKKLGNSFKIYFVLLILANVFYIGKTSDSIKDIITIIVEELILIWIISKTINTKEKLEKVLGVLVITSGIVGIISIISVFRGYNIFYLLNTVNREMLMANYARLGLIRAEAGFGHPVYYAAYNVIMVLIAMYLIENKSNNFKYKICLAIDLYALFFSNSRGSMIMMIVMLVYSFLQKNRKALKEYISVLGLLIAVAIIIIASNPKMLGFFSNTYASVKNVVASEKTEIEDYGRNVEGMYSRTAQLSGIKWVFENNNFLFGFGSNAHVRGEIKYEFTPGKWTGAKTFDVGYVAIFCQYGIIGTLAYMSMYLGICIVIFKNRKKDNIYKMFKYVFISYFLCQLSITGVPKLFWCLCGLLIAYENINFNEKKEYSINEGTNKKMKIGIFGVELTSVNYGCSALCLTQLQFLEKIILENGIDNEYYIFSKDSLDKIDAIKEQLNIKSNIIIKKIINFRDGIKGFRRVSDEIKECDYIIDVTYGDSFSDIYGFKNYILYTLPKLMALHNGKDLIIAPQTIGPYKNIIAKIISKKVLKKAEYLCVRDEKSLEYAKKLSGRNDIILASDLAMELPYTKNELPGNKFKVGINVSELLWENSEKDNKEKFGIIVDYKKIVENIINKFTNDKYELHLITHVYSQDDTKGEFVLAQKIHEMFPNTILAPKFDTPIEAKNYMSGLDLFLGARMHATIGSFSSGVPVIPISYSRKFEGLYGSLGYNYGINLRDTTIEKAMEHIEYCLNNYDKLEGDRKRAFEEALNRNKSYHELLEKIIIRG